jgi:hypothetical protein
MRPAGEIRHALLKAATELATPECAPTLREIATKAQVGFESAMYTVKNMTRAGELEVAGAKRVEYRNRPVATYRPAGWSTGAEGSGFVALGQLMSAWRR